MGLDCLSLPWRLVRGERRRGFGLRCGDWTWVNCVRIVWCKLLTCVQLSPNGFLYKQRAFLECAVSTVDL